MSTVYLNSPPFKKRSTNSSHLNASFLTLIIEGFFFKFWFISEHFSQQNKNTKIYTLGWGMKISIWLSTWSPVGALQNKSNYMKIALRLLCRLRWIFKDHEENPFSPETFALSNIIKKKNVGFLEHTCPWKSTLTPALLFENHGTLFSFEKWTGIGCLSASKKRIHGTLVAHFCYKRYCMAC